jgi:hypothetical protein
MVTHQVVWKSSVKMMIQAIPETRTWRVALAVSMKKPLQRVVVECPEGVGGQNGDGSLSSETY